MNITKIKRDNSLKKVTSLKTEFANAGEFLALPDLAIFVTGSYAREEASQHSDIDLFFVYNGSLEKLTDPRIESLRMFSKVVEVADKLEFPRFSNDGEYLKILEKPEILHSLGGRHDDYENHFTARMLLILESKCIYGQPSYDLILDDILSAYFKDYPDHPKDFQPTFLVNDILRFWKTLCLNYENKRNQPVEDSKKKIAQKIKNLKLKFSRMLTCFGSVCYIISKTGPIGPEDLSAMLSLNPMKRLEESIKGFDDLRGNLTSAQEDYEWFLELTNVSEVDLQQRFSEKNFELKLFSGPRNLETIYMK